MFNYLSYWLRYRMFRFGIWIAKRYSCWGDTYEYLKMAEDYEKRASNY